MICPVCKAKMSYDNDFTFDDLGYIGEGIVSFYECLNCGTLVEVDIPDDGKKVERRRDELPGYLPT